MGKKAKFHREMQAWNNARSRCCNPKATGYDITGAVGITMCQRWQDSFNAFMEDMGEAPAGTMLGRYDKTSHFTPENCYWQECKERRPRECKVKQGRPSEIYLTAKGKTQSAREWEEQLGIKYTSICYRNHIGWTPEQCLGFEPAPKRRPMGRKSLHMITARGKTQSLRDWARETGLGDYTIYYRMKRGVKGHDILDIPLRSRIREWP